MKLLSVIYMGYKDERYTAISVAVSNILRITLVDHSIRVYA